MSGVKAMDCTCAPHIGITCDKCRISALEKENEVLRGGCGMNCDLCPPAWLNKCQVDRGRLKELETEADTLRTERDEADRRAGSAERQLARERENTTARNSWLRDAKKAWGVSEYVSFDNVWAECLALRAEITRLVDAPADTPIKDVVARLHEELATPSISEIKLVRNGSG